MVVLAPGAREADSRFSDHCAILPPCRVTGKKTTLQGNHPGEKSVLNLQAESTIEPMLLASRRQAQTVTSLVKRVPIPLLSTLPHSWEIHIRTQCMTPYFQKYLETRGPHLSIPLNTFLTVENFNRIQIKHASSMNLHIPITQLYQLSTFC